MYSNLTIVLLLKNRAEFNERFINYFNKKNYNHRLIISDGSKKKLSSSLLKKIKKNKFIQYLKFREDKSYELFYKKVFETVKYVKSKYLIFAANDDFFIYENLNKCLTYLQSNKNFIGSGGTMIGFKINKINKKNKLTNMYYLYNYIKLDHKNNKKRFDSFIQNFSDLPRNCIMKRDVLIKNYQISSSNFENNIEFKDHFNALFNVISGKIKIFKDPIILHQDHDKNEASNRAKILKSIFQDKNFINDLIKFDFILSKKLKFKKNYVINKYYNYVLSNLINSLNIINEPSIKQIKSIMFKKIKRKIFNKLSSKKIFDKKVSFNRITEDAIKFIENNIIN